MSGKTWIDGKGYVSTAVALIRRWDMGQLTTPEFCARWAEYVGGPLNPESVVRSLTLCFRR